MPCRHRWRCVEEIQYKSTHTHAWTCRNAPDHSCIYGSPDGPHDNTTHRGNCSPWELHTYSTNMHNLSEMRAYTKPDFKVRITYLLLSMCCLAVRVGGFVAIIATVWNLFHLTFRMDLSPPLSPWPWHLCLLLSHTHLPPSPHPPFSLSPRLIGTGLVSQWRRVQIQLVCVMLCCLILLSDSHSGQESSWTRIHARTRGQTHTPGQDKSLPRDSLFIHHIAILPVSHREQGQMGAGGGGGGMCCCFTLECCPSTSE